MFRKKKISYLSVLLMGMSIWGCQATDETLSPSEQNNGKGDISSTDNVDNYLYWVEGNLLKRKRCDASDVLLREQCQGSSPTKQVDLAEFEKLLTFVIPKSQDASKIEVRNKLQAAYDAMKDNPKYATTAAIYAEKIKKLDEEISAMSGNAISADTIASVMSQLKDGIAVFPASAATDAEKTVLNQFNKVFLELFYRNKVSIGHLGRCVADDKGIRCFTDHYPSDSSSHESLSEKFPSMPPRSTSPAPDYLDFGIGGAICTITNGKGTCWTDKYNTGEYVRKGLNSLGFSSKTNLKMISTRETSMCFVTTEGMACSGDGSTKINLPDKLKTNKNIIAVKCGFSRHFAAYNTDTTTVVTSWDADPFMPGSGPSSDPALDFSFSSKAITVKLDAEGEKGCALLENNKVECFEEDYNGGNPQIVSLPIPDGLKNITNPVSISMDNDILCALDDSGVHCSSFRSSPGASGADPYPAQLPLPENLVRPVALVGDRCVLDDDGTNQLKLKCWGMEIYNHYSAIMMDSIPSDLVISK